MADHIYIFRNSTLINDNKAQSIVNNTKKSIIKYQNIYKFSYNKQLSVSDLFRIKKLLVVNHQFMASEISQNNILLANRSNYKSPWSEKARQIISNCGFDDNLKIDHLRLYCIPNNKAFLKIKSDPSILCDNMTQLILSLETFLMGRSCVYCGDELPLNRQTKQYCICGIGIYCFV